MLLKIYRNIAKKYMLIYNELYTNQNIDENKNRKKHGVA